MYWDVNNTVKHSVLFITECFTVLLTNVFTVHNKCSKIPRTTGDFRTRVVKFIEVDIHIRALSEKVSNYSFIYYIYGKVIVRCFVNRSLIHFPYFAYCNVHAYAHLTVSLAVMLWAWRIHCHGLCTAGSAKGCVVCLIQVCCSSWKQF
jgi:hypothetical protein